MNKISENRVLFAIIAVAIAGLLIIISIYTNKYKSEEKETTSTTISTSSTTTKETTAKKRFKYGTESLYEECIERHIKIDFPNSYGFVLWSDKKMNKGTYIVYPNDILVSDRSEMYFKVNDKKSKITITSVKVGSTKTKVKDTFKC